VQCISYVADVEWFRPYGTHMCLRVAHVFVHLTCGAVLSVSETPYVRCSIHKDMSLIRTACVFVRRAFVCASHMCLRVAHVFARRTCVCASHMCLRVAHVFARRTCVCASHMCLCVTHVFVRHTCVCASHMSHPYVRRHLRDALSIETCR